MFSSRTQPDRQCSDVVYLRNQQLPQHCPHDLTFEIYSQAVPALTSFAYSSLAPFIMGSRLASEDCRRSQGRSRKPPAPALDCGVGAGAPAEVRCPGFLLAAARSNCGYVRGPIRSSRRSTPNACRPFVFQTSRAWSPSSLCNLAAIQSIAP